MPLPNHAPSYTVKSSRLQDSHIRLAHGNGGRLMRELIESIFVHHLGNPQLNTSADAGTLLLPPGELVVTTDGFTVQPLEFPGGDIGSLAVHGTINDLAVSGAQPLALTLSVMAEEGLAMEQLDRIVCSLAAAARQAQVQVIAGDTKVLRRGEGGGLYLSMTGLGIRSPSLRLGTDRVRPGDAILVSGPVGDHGAAVLLAREEYGLHAMLHSDSASVLPLTRALTELNGLRFMRDPTRGGLATVMCEVVHDTGLGIILEEQAIPVRENVQSLCDLLGYDPLYLACEGRVVAVIDADQSQQALHNWRNTVQGQGAAVIGRVVAEAGEPILHTHLGGERVLDELEDDPLPRIC